MKTAHFSATAMAVLLALTGCAELQQKTGMGDKTASTVGGAAIGCAAGAVFAKLTGGNAAKACIAGSVVGGLIGFEKARQAEIAAAEQTRRETMAALAALPKDQAKDVKVGEIKTVEVTATDKATKQTSKYAAFDSVTVDMPLSAKGSAEYEAALGKLKTLAERVADERGSSEIIISVNAAEAKAKKVTQESNSVKTKNGGTVTVSKRIEAAIPNGMQRMTVKAGTLATEV